jgi:hypothetical protein
VHKAGYDVVSLCHLASKISSSWLMWFAQLNESCGNNEVFEGSFVGHSLHSEKNGHDTRSHDDLIRSAEIERSTLYGERKQERMCVGVCVCEREKRLKTCVNKTRAKETRNKVRCSLRSIHYSFDAIRSLPRRRPLLARQCQARLARPLPLAHELY